MNSIFLSFISTIITFLLYIPFIKLLYKLKIQDPDTKNQEDIFGAKTPIFQQLRKSKSGTPIGGGLLVILVTTASYLLVSYFFNNILNQPNSIYSRTLIAILLTFLSFACIGLYDDIKKTFRLEGRAFQLRAKHKFILQIIIALIISFTIVSYNLISFPIELLNTPGIKIILIALVITFFSNAVNITDGSDGLAGGLLSLALIPLWIYSIYIGNNAISIFIGLIEGSLLAFMYFNVNPARVFMGDSGALAFGAIFAVICLLLNIPILLPVIGFIFIIEALSSLAQWTSKRIFKKKLFPIAPLHYSLEYYGWPVTKVVYRAWLLQIFISVIVIAFLVA